MAECLEDEPKALLQGNQKTAVMTGRKMQI